MSSSTHSSIGGASGLARPRIGLWSKNACGSPAASADSPKPSYSDRCGKASSRSARRSSSAATASSSSAGAGCRGAGRRCGAARAHAVQLGPSGGGGGGRRRRAAPATPRSRVRRRRVHAIDVRRAHAARRARGEPGRPRPRMRPHLDVDVDEQGRVVGRLLPLRALRSISAHVTESASGCEASTRSMRMPLCLWKLPGPVVPPAVQALVAGVALAEHVGRPHASSAAKAARSSGGHVGAALEPAGSHTSRSSGATLKSPHTATSPSAGRRPRRGPAAGRATRACGGSARARPPGRWARRPSTPGRRRTSPSAGGLDVGAPRRRRSRRPGPRGRPG